MSIEFVNREVLNRFAKRLGALKEINNVKNSIVKEVSTQMIIDMQKYISENAPSWIKDYRSFVNVDNIKLISVKNGIGTIQIGSESDLIQTGNGDLVNAFFFIEFGFGLTGEKKPTTDSNKFGWDYNIRKHDEAQSFNWMIKGAKGLSFIERIKILYSKKWIQIAKEVLKREGIVGNENI